MSDNRKQAVDRRRRRIVGAMSGALALSGSLPLGSLAASKSGFDVVVVGAGVFGIWTACMLQRSGLRVAVIDAVSPAHSRASSGGESRVTRCGYGSKQLYSELALQSLPEWRDLSERASLPLFHELGVLWLHQAPDQLVDASAETLAKIDVPYKLMSAAKLRKRYPGLRVDENDSGFFEPWGGALMARRAVQTLAVELAAAGVTFLSGEVLPVVGENGVLPKVGTKHGETVTADRFVFACGPWMDQVVPDVMAERLFVTRQEVFFFGVDHNAQAGLPVWADLPFYGMPGLEGQGFKVANDTHGPALSPDHAERRASAEGEAQARAFLEKRFPGIANAPLVGSRVCQYENSSNGDFLIDRHPALENVWLVGCGSGHGFKHGPAVGKHVAELVQGRAEPLEPFLLANKSKQQTRSVQ